MMPCGVGTGTASVVVVVVAARRAAAAVAVRPPMLRKKRAITFWLDLSRDRLIGCAVFACWGGVGGEGRGRRQEAEKRWCTAVSERRRWPVFVCKRACVD
jgi:hypothetical protein